MLLSRTIITVVLLLGGCACACPSGDPPPGSDSAKDSGGLGDTGVSDTGISDSGPLPGEFETCTADLRCESGLDCIAGGGECIGVPASWTFCAQECLTDAECPSNRCALGASAAGFPGNFCFPQCFSDAECDALPNTLIWHCNDTSLNACLITTSAYDCASPDAGTGTDAASWPGDGGV